MLEEFEKWWSDNDWADYDCGSHKECAKETWIAALEWIFKNGGCPGEDYKNLNEENKYRMDYSCRIQNVVSEELGDLLC